MVSLIRLIVGLVLLGFGVWRYFTLPPAGDGSGSATWHKPVLFGLAGAGVLLHLVLDAFIARRVARGVKNTDLQAIPKYRMENMRQLSAALIVTSGVILGLAKSRGGDLLRLDTILLAAGIIFGFINLNVHGGAAYEEVDAKTTIKTTDVDAKTEEKMEYTYKLIYLETNHEGVSTVLLNLQFLCLLLGIAFLN